MGAKLANVLGRLMGRGAKEPSSEPGPPVDYKGYTIRPASRRQGSQWLTEGTIAKTFGEEVKEHHFIRADMHGTKEEADAFSVEKAKQIIDKLGDRIFEGQ